MDLTKHTIIVSPSGKLYGSEQVLCDFLYCTKNNYTVFVPRSSQLYQRLEGIGNHNLRQYDSKRPTRLYLRIVIKLLFGKYKSVYVNEGGHIKYIRLLSRIFKSVKFTIHLRMIYDAKGDRVGYVNIANIQLIAISKFVANEVPVQWNCKTIYDPFLFVNQSAYSSVFLVDTQRRLRVGIIGRISRTKGFFEAEQLFKYLETNSIDHFEFNFFGTLSADLQIQNSAKQTSDYKNVKVKFHGFTDQDHIYDNIDCVCHFCEAEGLGRVLFEAINRQKPFVGFRTGGLTEVASAFQLDSLLVEKDEDWVTNFLQKLNNIKSNYDEYITLLEDAKNSFAHKFSISEYSNKIENLI